MLQGLQLKEHVLNRVGYGQALWNSDRYDELGAAGYIAEQLGATLPTIAEDGVYLTAKILRGAVEQRQLEAVLRSFWFNHFNVFAPANLLNNIAGVSLWPYENLVIAPHVFGRFGDMLLEVAKSPSMIEFLDNRFSTKLGPNENYARELMELHTIGIDGGYTEADVKNVARIFTGWTLDAYRVDDVGPLITEFLFQPEWHDTDAKKVLGEDFPAGGGMEEGEALLEMLAAHPSAGTFLAYKLCAHFVSETPPASLVSQLATVFYDSDGDLHAVMSALLASTEFVDSVNFRSKAKAPHRWIASALAAMGVTASTINIEVTAYQLNAEVRAAGESPYMNPIPAGYPDVSGYWISPVAMEQRFIAAGVIAERTFHTLEDRAGVDGSDPEAAVDACTAVMIPGGIAASTRSAILEHLALTPGDPNHVKLIAVAQLLLCTPEFLRY